jgi:hypothetical protein
VILSVVLVTVFTGLVLATVITAIFAFLVRCQIIIFFALFAFIAVACFAKSSCFAFFGSIGANAEVRFFACTSSSIKYNVFISTVTAFAGFRRAFTFAGDAIVGIVVVVFVVTLGACASASALGAVINYITADLANMFVIVVGIGISVISFTFLNTFGAEDVVVTSVLFYALGTHASSVFTLCAILAAWFTNITLTFVSSHFTVIHALALFNVIKTVTILALTTITNTSLTLFRIVEVLALIASFAGYTILTSGTVILRVAVFA